MSKFKGVFAPFLSKFLLIRMTADLIPSRFVWFHCGYASEFFSPNYFLKCSKKTAKYKYFVEFIRQAVILSKYWIIEAQNKKKIYQNLDKKRAKTTLNFDTFYLRLLRLSEVKKGSNGWSGINFHYSGPHQA